MPRRRRVLRSSSARARVRMMLAFGALAALALGLQYLLFDRSLQQLAAGLPSDGALLLQQADRMLLNLLVGSFVVLMPITFLMGILATHRLLGPLGRLERFLAAALRGEPSDELRLRHSDDLHEVCWMVNALLARQRRTRGPEAAPDPDEAQTKEAA